MGGGGDGKGGAPPPRCPQGQSGDTEQLQGDTEEAWGSQHTPLSPCVCRPPPTQCPQGGHRGTMGDTGGGLWRDYGAEGASTLSITLCVSPISVPNSRVGLQRRHGGGRTEGTWGGYRGGMGEAGSASTPPPSPRVCVPPVSSRTAQDHGGATGGHRGDMGGGYKGVWGCQNTPPRCPQEQGRVTERLWGDMQGLRGGQRRGSGMPVPPPHSMSPPVSPRVGWGRGGAAEGCGGGDTQRGHGVF